jgi:hypothetical protein
MPSNPPGPTSAADAYDAGAVHVLTLTASNGPALLEAVTKGLAEAGADLAALTLRAAGQVAEATLRLTGVSCAAARDFADRMADRPGVLSSRVEHHLLRP